MPSAWIYTFTAVYALIGCVLAHMETVVGVAGRTVTLPCHSTAMSQDGVGVCWGRGQPTVFTCQRAVIDTSGTTVLYRKSSRYTLSSRVSQGDVSLSIHQTRLSDSGFYHCRIQLPGLFNDQTSSIHLIIVNGGVTADPQLPVPSKPFIQTPVVTHMEAETTSYTTPSYTGSDVAGEETMVPKVAQVKTPKEEASLHLHRLEAFLGNTLRLAFVVFIPALLLLTAYRLLRSKHRDETFRRQTASDLEGIYHL
ncbi:hepatitis A virus cellular receptor 1 homolog isoform X2 [Lampris incognitus]|uniref:hepatitis A virus cellular receptor 1 homolog isoform X2 n=1 Tax=Lampris incognitus TaxID=2546036 RepID=UPI0024B4F370|nr:hepatitis A virus cellular receptor 1 homolog isoform X2 [Lampris incognitus]